MELILVRHGQPAWQTDGVVTNDPHLTPLGMRQADALTHRQWADVDELWVSPMHRAMETAAPLAAALGLEPVVHEWMREIGNPPEWEGSPVEEVDHFFATGRLRPLEELWQGMPGGESFRTFHQRVAGGLETTIGLERLSDQHPHVWARPPSRRIVMVAHGGTNAVVLGHLLGVEPTPWEWDRFDSAHTSVATIDTKPIAHGVAFGLLGFGDVEHLAGDDVTR